MHVFSSRVKTRGLSVGRVSRSHVSRILQCLRAAAEGHVKQRSLEKPGRTLGFQVQCGQRATSLSEVLLGSLPLHTRPALHTPCSPPHLHTLLRGREGWDADVLTAVGNVEVTPPPPGSSGCSVCSLFPAPRQSGGGWERTLPSGTWRPAVLRIGTVVKNK